MPLGFLLANLKLYTKPIYFSYIISKWAKKTAIFFYLKVNPVMFSGLNILPIYIYYDGFK